MNRHTRYRPATTTRNTATQRIDYIDAAVVSPVHCTGTVHRTLREQTLTAARWCFVLVRNKTHGFLSACVPCVRVPRVSLMCVRVSRLPPVWGHVSLKACECILSGPKQCRSTGCRALSCERSHECCGFSRVRGRPPVSTRPVCIPTSQNMKRGGIEK